MKIGVPKEIKVAENRVALIPAAAAAFAASDVEAYRELDQFMNVWDRVRSEYVEQIDDKTLIRNLSSIYLQADQNEKAAKVLEDAKARGMDPDDTPRQYARLINECIATRPRTMDLGLTYKAVANGEVDIAVVWGPLAGYFAKSSPVAATSASRSTGTTSSVSRTPLSMPPVFEIAIKRAWPSRPVNS